MSHDIKMGRGVEISAAFALRTDLEQPFATLQVVDFFPEGVETWE